MRDQTAIRSGTEMSLRHVSDTAQACAKLVEVGWRWFGLYRIHGGWSDRGRAVG